MRTAIALLGLLAIAGTASARPAYFEVGDAGDLPGGAQPVDSDSGLITTISGATDVNTGDLGDYYLIDIKDPSAFSASTVNGPGTAGDTCLYLMTTAGTGIAANDDFSGGNFLSLIPAGDPLVSTLSPGQYLLLVTSFGVLPAWNPAVSVTSLIFPISPFTGVKAPQNSTDPHISYLFLQGFDTGGSYTVELTGASFVPTPGTAALVGLGGLLAARRRRA